MTNPIVGIIMGSDSDLEIMKESALILEEFDVPYDMTILSAHRTPHELVAYMENANKNYKVIIAGAGAAAHLPGVIASHTTLPVIGVPIDSSPLNGVDSLYAIVQMPGGIPVATMAIGKAGAKNAGIFAVQILSTAISELNQKLSDYRKKLANSVINKSEQIKSIGWKKYLG